MAWALQTFAPKWRGLRVHESSPSPRGVSAKLKAEVDSYIESQFWPDHPLGEIVKGVRNENLEKMSFEDGSFDIHISLDVLEHVNNPKKVFQEVARTLSADGLHIFTCPTFKGKVETTRKGLYIDGEIEFIGAPEYHQNPISSEGSPVTFHYGYDLPQRIRHWSGMNTIMTRFHHHEYGIIGDFTEVYICSKR